MPEVKQPEVRSYCMNMLLCLPRLKVGHLVCYFANSATA